MSNRKIIILTASYGDGHHKVSEAIKQAFLKRGYADPEIRIVDLFREAYPVLDAISRYMYRRSPAFSSFGLDYYGWSYYVTRGLNARSLVAKGINLLGMRRLIDIIVRERPAAIVTTFPYGGIPEQLVKEGLDIPLFTVITDFRLHNRWLYSAPARYYVPTPDMKQDLLRSGVREDRIAVSGIPLREGFYRTDADHEESGQRRSVLIQAGAFGIMRDIREIIRSLLQIPDVQLTVICGKNGKLKRELEEAYMAEDKVRVLGYVDNPSLWMRGAACLVSKAGGVTMAEAIQLRIPVLVYKPIPGQERENARYLEEKGAAFVSKSVPALKSHAETLIGDLAARRQATFALRSLGQGDSASMIVRDIIGRLRASAPVAANTGS